MKILGIHDSHNASVALLEDGKLLAAVQEERLTREKNQYGMPRLAIQNVLDITDSSMSDVDQFAFVGRYQTFASGGDTKSLLRSFASADYTLKMHLRTAFLASSIGQTYWKRMHASSRRELVAQAGFPSGKVQFIEHHSAHAAAAYFGWGKMDEPILVLTVDASGDGLSATVNTAHHGRITRVAAISVDDSLGYLYAIVTYLMGMTPNEHEFKVMGLAPYAGDAPNVRKIADAFARLYEFDPKNPLIWHRTRGTPPIANAKAVIEAIMKRERFDWIAGGLQLFIERFLTQWVRNCIQHTGIGKVALSGGVFMNVKANMEILKLSEVDELFVFPSCGDESNAIGAAYAAYADLANSMGKQIQPLSALYLGEDLTDQQAKAAIESFQFSQPVSWSFCDDVEKKVAELLADGKVVARAKGRMEFGARALGNRSILADPSLPQVVRIINDMIKMRDFWMPFAPVLRAEQSDQYMIKPKPMPAPYMIITFDVHPEKRAELLAALHPYDWTARPQEVSRDSNRGYYQILQEFHTLTGRGVLLNTSFNLHGYPIVYRANDALDVFNRSGLRYLALSNFLVEKKS